MPDLDDGYWMQQALKLAAQAKDQGEVPVGALVVGEQKLLGQGYNQVISLQDPSAHAEVMALRGAGITQQNYRLVNTTLYVTLEPCMMCAGVLVHARIKRLVFGAYDPKAGAISSCAQLLTLPHLNHQILVQGGILAKECGQQLTDFFKAKRQAKHDKG
jgi:tRNA(adenine34) deaminase